jgi:hypothetical protein
MDEPVKRCSVCATPLSHGGKRCVVCALIMFGWLWGVPLAFDIRAYFVFLLGCLVAYAVRRIQGRIRRSRLGVTEECPLCAGRAGGSLEDLCGKCLARIFLSLIPTAVCVFVALEFLELDRIERVVLGLLGTFVAWSLLNLARAVAPVIGHSVEDTGRRWSRKARDLWDKDRRALPLPSKQPIMAKALLKPMSTRLANVGDHWREFVSYPVIDSYLTAYGVSGTAQTTTYDKGTPQLHRVDASLVRVFFNWSILDSIYKMGCLSLFIIPISYLFVVRALAFSEAVFGYLGIPIYVIIWYFVGVRNALLSRMQDQARRERPTAAKGIIVSYPGFWRLFLS